ncbi:MAG: hypothetical protein M0Q42_12970 [Xanthomonadales bacterium]|nr:hypothetical protein [Xanthomonadales bacterium]
MKKNVLTHAVIAGIVGVAGVGSIADAVNLNPDGLGQVLIYPYYTSQGGNHTLFTVVNTADVGKAVKVRFLEGRNSREVLDFHLYLSPHDVWTGAVVPNGAGAGVVTRDRSCTVPDIARGGLGFGGGRVVPYGDAFLATFVNNAYVGQFNDLGPQGLDRTREGYIEVIEMGDLDPSGTPHGWALHNSSGEPGNCLALNRAWFSNDTTVPGVSQWSLGADANWGLTAPWGHGELFGNAMIINPARGIVNAYNADAIEGFNHMVLHYPPQDTNPSLADVNNPGNPAVATANVFIAGTAVAATYDAAGATRGKVDAITALYMSPRVINEYFLDDNDGVTFNSEWLINFPTKRFYVDTKPSFRGLGIPAGPYTTLRAPFSREFGAGGSCEVVSVTVYDREELTFRPEGGGFSPPDTGPDPDSLCWEAQVISFNQEQRVIDGEPSNILGATYFKNVNAPDGYEHGWAHVNFLNATTSLRASAEGVVFHGLPVTGFFATNADNGNWADSADGVLSNYSALFRHRTERSVDLLS